MQRTQLENSDVISFHSYQPAHELDKSIQQLRRFQRPLLCTEYMARATGSTFQAALPVLKRHGVAAYNWGLVSGRSQTIYPWDSWQQPCPPEPPLWFHDILRPDGSPYREEEVAFLRSTLRG